MLEIEINDQLHPVAYGMLGYKKIEEYSGKSFTNLDFSSISDQIAIIYAGMFVGYRRKGKMIPFRTIDDLAEALPLPTSEKYITIVNTVTKELSDEIPSGKGE